MSKKKNKHSLFHRKKRKLKWYSSREYWQQNYATFKSFFEEDRPWYKSLAQYIYLESSIFNFFYKRYRITANFSYNVGRVYKWLPILWNDRDFDYAFLWPILRKKIENMEKVISNGSSATRLTVKAELLYVRLLLERIEAGDYDDEETTDQSSNSIFIEELHQQEDIEKLFTFMAKHHRKWWD
jgi:hypothetical protein